MGEKVMELPSPETEEQTAEEAEMEDRRKINFSKDRRGLRFVKQQHSVSTTAALMCFSLPGENSGDVHSSSSPQTHPVFTQHLARRRRLAVQSWPTGRSLWAAEHNRNTADRERRLKTKMHITSFSQHFSSAKPHFKKKKSQSLTSSLPINLHLECKSTSLVLSLCLFAHSHSLSSSSTPFLCVFFWLRSERKTLLYQRQTSGDPDPLSADTALAAAAKLPSAPAQKRWINAGIVAHTRTCWTGRTRWSWEGLSNFSVLGSSCLNNMHRHTLLEASGFSGFRQHVCHCRTVKQLTFR